MNPAQPARSGPQTGPRPMPSPRMALRTSRGTSYMERTRPLLEDALEASVGRDAGPLGAVHHAMAQAVGTRGRGGRRWRPLLTLAAAEAAGIEPEDALPVAVAVELTHTASLVLDDMPCMDDSDHRRGQESTHLLVGSAGAILLSVGLLARAAEMLAGSPGEVDGLCSDWGRTFGLEGMAGGQAVDLSAKGPVRGALRRLHREKSTALSAFAVSAGARVAGAPDDTRIGLFRFGRDLGWAYQLADDAVDLEEDRALGRAPGGRRPRRQSGILLRRALNALEHTPGLDGEGRRLLASLAVLVVPSATPESNQEASC